MALTKVCFGLFLAAAVLISTPANAQLSLNCNTNSFPNSMTLGNPYSLSCFASGGTAPYAFSYTGTLPTGMATLTAGSEYFIEGTANTVGVYSFSVNVNDSASGMASQAFMVTVGGAITLTSLSPTTLTAGAPATLSINGTGFTANSVVNFNGTLVTTTYQSSTGLSASIPASLVTIGTLPVYVHDPALGNSGSLYVTVAPTLTSISPTTVQAGSGAFTLTILGSGLSAGATVSFGNVCAVSGTLINSGGITAQIPASCVITAQTVNVSVNGSNALQFVITAVGNGTVTLTAVSPTSTPVGVATVLTLSGTNFTTSSIVHFNGTLVQTSYQSATTLLATIPALVVTLGSLPVYVTDPATGTSNTLNITGTNSSGSVTLNSITPTSLQVGSGQFTLTLFGSGFTAGTIVNFGSVCTLGATFINSSEITAIIPASCLTLAQTVSVSAGGSNSIPFVIAKASSGGPVTLTSVAPTSLAAGTVATLTLAGSGFAPTSVVYFNGTAVTTTYQGPTLLSASIPVSLEIAGAQGVYVHDTASGITSGTLSVSVTPELTQISPSSIPVGAGSFVLTLNGAGFTSASQVSFGSYVFAANFVNSSQLILLIPASAITTAQTLNVSAGGSNALQFVVGSGGLSVTCLPPSAVIILGSFYSETCSVTGGTAPYFWTDLSVPAGIILAPSPGGATLTMSGTPTTVGVQTIAATATDSSPAPLSGSASASLTVQVSMPATKVGIFRNNTTFLEDSNGNGIFDPGFDRVISNFAGPGGYTPGDVPVVGDWTGDGHTKVGIYRASSGTWYLDANNDGIFDAGDYTYQFGGLAGDLPVVGDWNGVMGVTTDQSCIGIYRSAGSVWLLDMNCNGVYDGTPTDAFFPFGGLTGDVPVVGSWTGSHTRVGVVRSYAPQGVPTGPPFFWVLDNSPANAGSLPENHQPASYCFAFGGLSGDVFVTGDWYNTGLSAAGVYRGGLWVLDSGLPGAPQTSHAYGWSFGYGGLAGDIPLPGNW